MGSTGLVRKNGKIIVFMQSFLDVIVIALTLLLARVLWDQPVFVTRVLMLLFTSITFFSFFANMAGLYRSSRAERFWEEYRLALMVFGCALLALLILGYATKTTALFSRLAIGTWILLVPLLPPLSICIAALSPSCKRSAIAAKASSCWCCSCF